MKDVGEIVKAVYNSLCCIQDLVKRKTDIKVLKNLHCMYKKPQSDQDKGLEEHDETDAAKLWRQKGHIVGWWTISAPMAALPAQGRMPI